MPTLHLQHPTISVFDVEELMQDILDDPPLMSTSTDNVAFVGTEEQAALAEIGIAPEDIPEAPTQPTRSGRGPGQNEMLNDWVQNESQQFLRELYMLYVSPIGACFCKNTSPEYQKFQCNDCITDRHFCGLCLKSIHRNSPTHQISLWNGETWSRTSLAEQGLVIKVANHEGCLCSKPEALLLGDITGFHNIHVAYCGCSGAPDRYVQLLRLSIMPCSTHDPESGFTFSSLHMFDFLAADAKLSANRYHSTLQRQNNNIEPDSQQHQLRELLRVTREWTFLQFLKRAGQTMPMISDPGALTVRCPACPHLDFNYQASDVQEDTRYLFAQQLSYDGSFQLVRKHKAHDDFDICLSDGLMYWVKQDDYKAHLEANKDTAYNQNTHVENERAEHCNNHRAVNDTWVRWTGVAETGMGAVTCARHTLFMPIGAVSYWKGERYGYTDFAVTSQIWLLMKEGTTEIGFFYDIFCQWSKNFWARAPDILLPNGPLVQPSRFFGGIPKYHLAGHIDSCYALYSLNNMQGAGWLDAEGCERAWANINGASGSTSEKGPGARIDSLNHTMNDWNWWKFVTMITFNLKKLIEAERMAIEQKQAWLLVHDSLKSLLTRKWEAMSTVLRLEKNIWTSVFLLNNAAVTSRLCTVLDLNNEESERVANRNSVEIGLTVASWISEGIDIEKLQTRIKHENTTYGSAPTPKQCMDLYNRRMSLDSKVTTHCQKAAIFLDITLTARELLALLAEETDGHPEVATLYLPSQLDKQVTHTEQSIRVIEVEIIIRHAECFETLCRVRTTCMQKAQLISGKKKHARGEIANTRAQTMITRLSSRVDTSIEDYSRSFNALCKLVQSAQRSPFQELNKPQLASLDSILHADRAPGEGWKQLPWFWTVRDTDSRSDQEAEKDEFNEGKLLLLGLI